jgi:DNA-binding XRE family transcriptional regulator
MAERQSADRETESFEGLLLRHRGRTGLTQRQRADLVGVNRRSVQDWENGPNTRAPRGCRRSSRRFCMQAG